MKRSRILLAGKKNILTLLITTLAVFTLSGCCCGKKVDTPKKGFEHTPEMTSKQVEEKMNWRYCEESK